MSEVGQNYRAMSDRVFQPEVMLTFGMSEQGIVTALTAIQAAKDSKAFNGNRSFYFDHVRTLLNSRDATLFMDLADAPYNLNLPSVLKTGIIGPEGFKGDQILAALRGNTKKTTTLGVVEAGKVISSAYKRTVGDQLVNWLLSAAVLASLTAEELLVIRSTGLRQQYLTQLTVFLAAPSQENWESLMTNLLAYLHAAGKELFRYRNNKGMIHKDPTGSEVRLEGDTALRMISDQSLELRGLKASDEPNLSGLEISPIQIVGNTFHLPDTENSSFERKGRNTGQPIITGDQGSGQSSAKSMSEKEKKKRGNQYPAIYTTF